MNTQSMLHPTLRPMRHIVFRRVLLVLIVGLTVWLPQCALAQAKVGFVSTQAVRDRFQEFKTAQQRLEAVTSDWKREMEEQLTAINVLEVEIQKKRLVWSDVERREKDSILTKRKRDREEYVRKKFNAGGEFDTLAVSYLRPAETKIAAAVQDIASSDNYDIILDKGVQPLLVANPRYDITVKVMEKLGIYADDLKTKQQEAVDREDRQKQDQQKRVTPQRRRPTKPTDGSEK